MTTFTKLFNDKVSNEVADKVMEATLTGTDATVEQRFLHYTVQRLLMDEDVRSAASLIAMYLSEHVAMGIHETTKPMLKAAKLVSNKKYGVGYPHADGTNHYFAVTEAKVFDIDSITGKLKGPHGTEIIVHATLDYNTYHTNGVMESFMSSYIKVDKYGNGNVDTYIGDKIHLYPVSDYIIKEAQAKGVTLVGVYHSDQDPFKDAPLLVALGYMADLDEDKIKTLTSVIGEDIDLTLLEDNLWCSRVPTEEECYIGMYNF